MDGGGIERGWAIKRKPAFDPAEIFYTRSLFSSRRRWETSPREIQPQLKSVMITALNTWWCIGNGCRRNFSLTLTTGVTLCAGVRLLGACTLSPVSLSADASLWLLLLRVNWPLTDEVQTTLLNNDMGDEVRWRACWCAWARWRRLNARWSEEYVNEEAWEGIIGGKIFRRGVKTGWRGRWK